MTASKPPSHTDHPLRHYDRTCPGCQAEVTPAEGMPRDLVFRLQERARIRRQITSRKSVQEGQPDRIADLLEEAADAIQAERQRCEAAYTVIGEQKAELIKQGWALTAAESRAASDAKDARRLDWLEDITKCYWVTIQTQPSAKRVFSGQGLGIRAAIDAASGEAG